MEFTIAKGNKRFVNKLCKQLGIGIQWKGQTSLGYEVAAIETQQDHSFQELIEFNNSMQREFVTIDDSIHIDMENVVSEITKRRADFNQRYGKMFDKMKEGI